MVCFELDAIVGARILSGQALPISFGGAAIAACNGLRYASSLKHAVHSECMHSSALSLTDLLVPGQGCKLVMPMHLRLMVFFFSFSFLRCIYFFMACTTVIYFHPLLSLWTMSDTGW
jgi:hypothetical protein